MTLIINMAEYLENVSDVVQTQTVSLALECYSALAAPAPLFIIR